MATPTTPALDADRASDVFDFMADYDERWLGYGYLNERDNEHMSVARRGYADRVAVEDAIAAGFSYDDLFAWANSKIGRWYGEMNHQGIVVGIPDYLPSTISEIDSDGDFVWAGSK